MSVSLSSLFAGPRPFELRSLRWPADLRIAVLAPHPDDFDAIGVTLHHFHKLGCRIDLAVLTEGASGVEDGYKGAYTSADKGALRRMEQLESCEAFGLPTERVGFPNLEEDERGHPLANAGNREIVRGFLKQAEPHLVFMPHGNDSNIGHQRTYALFDEAAREDGLQLWACLNRDAKTLAMRTDLYTLFGESEADWKARLLRFHRSQHERNLRTRGHGFDERVLKVNRDAAIELKQPELYVEAFELQRYGEG